jgi:glutamyl-tRNA reductase
MGAGSLWNMKLAELQVLHFDATAFRLSPADLAAAGGLQQAWVISTCQRVVMVTAGREARERISERLPVAARAQGFSGAEAYAFLLRFACGLESRLAGETEIFGQIKESWRVFSAAPGLLSRQLDSWVQLLFKDTKEVRAGSLSSLGSASYGSQVRRLLGATSGPTLLVGAGQLAQTVAPWLETGELLLWNRNRERAVELARLVQERNPERACRVLENSAAAELAAWSSAADVVLCVPADAERDVLRIAAWRSRPAPGGRIVHLGLGNEAAGSHWQGVAGLTSLTALFDMLRAQSDQRSVQLTRARRACVEKAVLRSLGPSATQAHGWEDLAAFATISP